MQKILKINYFSFFFLIFCLFFTSTLLGRAVIDWQGKKYQMLKKYQKIHREFRHQLCPPGTEEKANDLFKAYRGDGFFVPLLRNNRLDRPIVSKYLPEIAKKKKWIMAEREKLLKMKNYRSFLRRIKRFDFLINQLLIKKRLSFTATSKQEKLKVAEKSTLLLKKLTGELERFVREVSFLQGYDYPVNHFELRKKYDQVKNIKTKWAKHKSNDIYFYRKMVEDGAQELDHTRNDTFFRTGLNSAIFNLKKERGIISENLRADLDYILSRLEKYLKWRKKRHLIRLGEWQRRIERKYSFYKNLLVKKRDLKGNNIVEVKEKSLFRIKDYVYKKQSQTFSFWSERPLLMRALFVLETILMNEVGSVDGRDALERWDVLQVIVNRLDIDLYSKISKDDAIYPYLKKYKKLDIHKFKWLNILFKEGEFSFTYFFIPSNKRIFCPEMTRRGRFLRDENLKLGLKKLKNSDDLFRALRYFSRGSMIGKVDMALLWKDFSPTPERRGMKSRHTRALRRAYKKGKYQFLYAFRDPHNNLLEVLKFKSHTYVFSSVDSQFFNYRNPHFFTYFEKK